MKDIDVLDKLRAFDDTMAYVNQLKGTDAGKHLHELWKVAKELGTEVRKLRKEAKQ